MLLEPPIAEVVRRDRHHRTAPRRARARRDPTVHDPPRPAPAARARRRTTTGSTSRSSRSTRRASSCCSSTRTTRAARSRSSDSTRRQPHLPLLAHVRASALTPGMHYAYRVDGPRDLHGGATGSTRKGAARPVRRGQHEHALGPGRRLRPGRQPRARRCAASSSTAATTTGRATSRSGAPMSDTIIYEMHVRGFTKSPTVGRRAPGHVRRRDREDPVPQGARRHRGRAAAGLRVRRATRCAGSTRSTAQRCGNFWGYDPYLLLRPAGELLRRARRGLARSREFRDMVKALHKAGIEVILDVVFNHTGEGNHMGPTISFKGLDNDAYYLLTSSRRPQYYMDYSGCGNTVNCNHPIVREVHPRLPALLGRGDARRRLPLRRGLGPAPRRRTARRWTIPPVVWEHRAVRGARRHEDDRRGVGRRRPLPGRPASRARAGRSGTAASATTCGASCAATRARRRRSPTRIAGSADMYQGGGALPDQQRQLHHRHDGFTLNDLVAYNEQAQRGQRRGQPRRHQRQPELELRRRGRHRRPGRSNALRARQVKNFAAILLLSQGVPMFVAGDEIGRTQRGNNNAYCQDNEISWFDWTLVERARRPVPVLQADDRAARAATRACAAARSSPASATDRGAGRHPLARRSSSTSPSWDDPARACSRSRSAGVRTPLEPDLHVMMNMDGRASTSTVPAATAGAGIASSTRRSRRPTTSPSRATSRRSRASAARSRTAAS